MWIVIHPQASAAGTSRTCVPFLHLDPVGLDAVALRIAEALQDHTIIENFRVIGRMAALRPLPDDLVAVFPPVMRVLITPLPIQEVRIA